MTRIRRTKPNRLYVVPQDSIQFRREIKLNKHRQARKIKRKQKERKEKIILFAQIMTPILVVIAIYILIKY